MPSPVAHYPYRIRHGFGYSVYEHVEDGIASELWIYVDPVDPVKYSVLKLRNLSACTAGCRPPATSNGSSETCTPTPSRT